MKILNNQIGLLLLLFLVSNVLLSQNGPKQINLEEVVKEYKFYPKSINGLRSMADGRHFTSLAEGRYIIKYKYEDGSLVDTLVNIDKIGFSDLRRAEGYSFSDDEQKVLMYINRERIYRRSFLADYFIYDLKQKTLQKLSANGKQQLASFSPDGSKIAFVRENNLYIKELYTDLEYAITTDGKFNYVINGAPDWVYEEEFGFNKAFSWSPDGRSIAYMRFNEANVNEFGMTLFSGTNPHIEVNEIYTEQRVWKYPKAGDANSIVTVHIYDVKSKKDVQLDIGPETDQYIPRIKWTPQNGQLCVYRLNRLQNKLDLLLADNKTGATKIIYTDENKYYIAESVLDDIFFLRSGNQMIVPGEKDGYYHLYLYNYINKTSKQVTSGNWDVTDFYGCDEESGHCFFQAAKITPLQREVYGLDLKSGNTELLTPDLGTNAAVFSSAFKYFINTYTAAEVPPVITLFNSLGNKIRVLEDNAAYRNMLTEYGFNQRQFFKFTTSENVELNAYYIKPPNFDPAKKYPVLISQYSGPNSQTVLDRWGIDWLHALAAKGYIIVSADGRGTGARGEEFRKMTYMQLGKYETMDQVETAKYLKTLSFVDPDRIGIYGWSYGGFVSSLSMVKGEGNFKAGIAVAPVTDYRYYDNIYTERYMRTPQENPDGYYENAPINFADQLQGNFLIIHGMADDNVHLQNTTEFIEKLVQADKQFEMQLYTNRNHSIYGGNTRFHLFSRMMNFLQDKL